MDLTPEPYIPMISLMGGFLIVTIGPQLVPLLLTSGLIAGALFTGMN